MLEYISIYIHVAKVWFSSLILIIAVSICLKDMVFELCNQSVLAQIYIECFFNYSWKSMAENIYTQLIGSLANCGINL